MVAEAQRVLFVFVFVVGLMLVWSPGSPLHRGSLGSAPSHTAIISLAGLFQALLFPEFWFPVGCLFPAAAAALHHSDGIFQKSTV